MLLFFQIFAAAAGDFVDCGNHISTDSGAKSSAGVPKTPFPELSVSFVVNFPYPNEVTRFAAVTTFCAESTTSPTASLPRFRYLFAASLTLSAASRT
jgi:hypothetical protein